VLLYTWMGCMELVIFRPEARGQVGSVEVSLISPYLDSAAWYVPGLVASLMSLFPHLGLVQDWEGLPLAQAQPGGPWGTSIKDTLFIHSECLVGPIRILGPKDYQNIYHQVKVGRRAEGLLWELIPRRAS